MNIVELFMSLQNQLRIYHWQTESYAEHKAFGEAYESFDELIDEFIEIFIGKNNRNKILAKEKFNLTIFNYNESITSNIDAYIDVLTEDIPKAVSEKDTDLLNIRDEMIGKLNQLKYLLTLK